MTGDSIALPKKQSAESPDHEGLGDWLANNVLHPLINGSGVIQIYDTFADKPVQLLHTDQAKTGSTGWAVQTLSQAAGAIVPFVIAGKLTGLGMGSLGERMGAEGMAGKFLASQSAAQILGAGAYEFLEKPMQGETRLGNTAGTMAAFAMFEGGNRFLNQSKSAFSSGIAKAGVVGLGRLSVGAAGGLVSYETSNYVSGLFGQPSRATLDGAWQAMATGGFMNFALPTVQEGASKVINFARGVAGGNSAAIVDSQTDCSPVKSSTTGRPKLSLVSRLSAGVDLAPGDRSAEPASADITRPAQATVEAEARSEQTAPTSDAPQSSPEPLGATVTDKGINFAIKAPGATGMDLLLFRGVHDEQPSQILPLTQTGDVWHTSVDGLKAGQLYLYRAEGPYTPAVDGSRYNAEKGLIDPYAKAVSGDNPIDGSALGYDMSHPDDPNRTLTPSTVNDFSTMPKAIAIKDDFDWKGDVPPDIPMTDSIIYELNLRGFTAGDESLGNIRGTYRGLMAKIPYLKDLGITTVELMPIFKFDAMDSDRVNPITGERNSNAWGYNTTAFQAPEGRFAADGQLGQQVNEFKSMVQEFHNNNMEVVLDVVFNHTGEGNEYGPTINFRGLANNRYYLLNPEHPDQYIDHTGCGNTVSANDPATQQFILDSLRYWVQEMHVDGFRFDLATIFKYMPDGSQLEKTPIISAIENDPILSKVKLIAEPWGPHQYYMGRFSDILWDEWNDAFRDTVRKFVKSDTGQVGELADRVAGTSSLFNESEGRDSVNFVTAHDGFTANDLVSYDGKHNESNGEHNKDGSDNNSSWNSGYEGPVTDAPISDAEKAAITALRTRQMKNLISFLMLSRGTPMLLYGDEVRRTQMGNNNAYNQPKLNEFNWKSLQDNQDMFRFVKGMIDLRKTHNIGRTSTDQIVWHGTEPGKPDFSDGTRFIAWQINPPGAKPLYMAFNAFWEPLEVQLPEGSWKQLVNTSAPTGQDVVKGDKVQAVSAPKITLPARSGVVFELQPDHPSEQADI